MARKKSTKKTTKKEKEEEIQEEEIQEKNPQFVNITFNPLYSAAQQKTVFLKKEKLIDDNGTEKHITVPSVEGLPMVFTIRKGDVVTITEDQYNELNKLGFVETQQERDMKIKMSGEIPPQSGLDPKPTKEGHVASFYNDQFIKVE